MATPAKSYIQPSQNVFSRGSASSGYGGSALRQQLAAQTQFRQQNVKLQGGEYVSNEAFKTLDPEDQALLKKLGIDKYAEEKQQRFEAANVKLATGEYVGREEFNKLDPEDQKLLRDVGIDKFKTEKEDAYNKLVAEFEASNIKLSTGEYVGKEDFGKLSSQDQKRLKNLGIEKFNAQVKAEIAAAQAAAAQAEEEAASRSAAPSGGESTPPAQVGAPTEPDLSQGGFGITWGLDPDTGQPVPIGDVFLDSAERDLRSMSTGGGSSSGRAPLNVTIGTVLGSLSSDPSQRRAELTTALNSLKNDDRHPLVKKDLEQKLAAIDVLDRARRGEQFADANGNLMSIAQIEASTAAAVSPFTTLGVTDFMKAVRLGFDLREWGISSSEIKELKQQIKAEDKLKPYKGDVVSAILDGLSDDVARVYGDDVLQAAQKELQATYKQDEINVLTTGMTTKQAAEVGKKQAAQAQAFAEAQLAALSRLAPFKDKDGNYKLADFFRITQSGATTQEQKIAKADKAAATLVAAGFDPKDISDARLAGLSANTTIGGKPVAPRPGFFQSEQMKLDNYLSQLRTDAMKVTEDNPNRHRLITQLLEGTSGVLYSYMAMIPGMVLIPGQILEKPGRSGELLYGMGKGLVEAARSVITPGTSSFDVAAATANLTMGAVGGVEMVAGLAGKASLGVEFIRTAARGDYVPLRSLVMERSTPRVEFTARQIADMEKAGVTPADVIRAGTKLNEQLVAGKKVATVKLGPVTVRIKNIGYQKAEGLSLFNSTPDITVLDRGGSVPIIKKFYTSAKAATEPMERSYLTGQWATTPGIAEIRIADPALISKIAPQEKLITGRKGMRTLEPEAPIPSLEELQGKGYRLEPIPGAAGRGVSFDSVLGPIEIRRFTLSKVTENPMGVETVKLGKVSNTGTAAIGDLHGTTRSASVFNDVNSAFGTDVIKGNPNDPSTWHWGGGKQTLVVLGDTIDRGPAYDLWRTTFNRLYDEAQATGGSVRRLLGNHELAYLSGDAIKGIRYTDAARKLIKSDLKEDILAGRVTAAAASEGKLYSHAGVSAGVFKNYVGKTADFVAKDLNQTLVKAVKKNDYSGKEFAKGRVEAGSSLLKNDNQQGGPFWLRPQEAQLGQLDLGFDQVVGHNPGMGVRSWWGDRFTEVDVSRRTGGSGVYADTTFARTQAVKIGTKAVPGHAPKLGQAVNAGLKAQAYRDTVADVFLGWDGRVQAIESLKANKNAVRELLKDLDRQIVERKAAKDSIGVKYLKLQKKEITSPTGKDYLYGGSAYWRDVVMGRQNSVKLLEKGEKSTRSELLDAARKIEETRDTITKMSDADVQRLYGQPKDVIVEKLTLPGARKLRFDYLSKLDEETLRQVIMERATELSDIVDLGLRRSIEPLLDRAVLAERYAGILQTETAGAGAVAAAARYAQSDRVAGRVFRDYGPPAEYEGRTPTPERSQSVREGRTRAERTLTEAEPIRSAGEVGRMAPTEAERVSPAETTRGTIPDEIARTAPAEISRVTPAETSRAGVENRPAETRPANAVRGITEGQPPYATGVTDDRAPRVNVDITRATLPPYTTTAYPPTEVATTAKPTTPTVQSRLIHASPTGQLIPEGSIAWATGSMYQGSGKNRVLRPVWKYIPPEDFGKALKPRTIYSPPHGAKNIQSASPYETIQVIGRSRSSVPHRLTVDLGWADIEVLDGTDIVFSGSGLDTDYGPRIGSPTTGMGVNDIGDLIPGAPAGVDRTKMGKAKPGRSRGETKVTRGKSEEKATTLRGVKVKIRR